MAYLSFEARAEREAWEAIRRAHGQNGPERPVRDPKALGLVALSGASFPHVVVSPGTSNGIGHHMGANVIIADGFFAEATRRLRASGASPAAAALGVQTLALIVQTLGFETFRAATDIPALARALELNAGRVGRVLQQLEAAGLIHRLKEGRSRPIIVNPRLAYRGGNKAIDGLVKQYDAAVTAIGDEV